MDKNIAIVVCPLNSIREDQLKVLQGRGISADILQFNSDEQEETEFLLLKNVDKSNTKKSSNTSQCGTKE